MADNAELELQQELQRFTTQFTDCVAQATAGLENSPRRAVRDQALRKDLTYVSSAMEIASGQSFLVNLLDMIVFIRLSRSVLERHWIPTLYHAEGAELADVFVRSEWELAAVAEKVLTAEQRQQLHAVIDDWLTENPRQLVVEGVRLADFSVVAGREAAARAIRAKGLLSSVKTASHAANQAMLLSERALFLFHRLPSLWRLQARLGAREVMSDAGHVARRGFKYLALIAGAGAAIRAVASLARSRRSSRRSETQQGHRNRRLIGKHR